MSKQGAGNLLQRLAAQGQGRLTTLRPRTMPVFVQQHDLGDVSENMPDTTQHVFDQADTLLPPESHNIPDLAADADIASKAVFASPTASENPEQPQSEGSLETEGPGLFAQTPGFTSDELTDRQKPRPLVDTVRAGAASVQADHEAMAAEFGTPITPQLDNTDKQGDASPTPPPVAGDKPQPQPDGEVKSSTTERAEAMAGPLVIPILQPELSSPFASEVSPVLVPALSPVTAAPVSGARAKQTKAARDWAGGEEGVEVHISIGRIEILPPAKAPSAKTPPKRVSKGPMPLQAYLKQRDGGKA